MQIAELDGAVGELVRDEHVAGWVAVEAKTFRTSFFTKSSGCWILTTWADGTVEIEEDHDPYVLVAELLSGTVVYEDHDGEHEVRWVTDHRRAALWERFGVHEPAGHYLALAARQDRARRGP